MKTLVRRMVREVRKTHPRAGTRKLMVYLGEALEKAQIKIGRNTLNTVLRENGMLVAKINAKKSNLI